MNVIYKDGWHWSVGEDGEPDEKLFLEDDGTYRPAEDGDESWHDRKHAAFATITPEDGMPGLTVTVEELGEIQKMLDERRGT